MEKELESRIFMIQNYESKEEMEKVIKEYICKLKNDYPFAIVTREFYKGKNVLVRASKMNFLSKSKESYEKDYQLEKEEIRIKEKGINGLGENVERVHNKFGRKEKARGGTERERGGR